MTTLHYVQGQTLIALPYFRFEFVTWPTSTFSCHKLKKKKKFRPEFRAFLSLVILNNGCTMQRKEKLELPHSASPIVCPCFQYNHWNCTVVIIRLRNAHPRMHISCFKSHNLTSAIFCNGGTLWKILSYYQQHKKTFLFAVFQQFPETYYEAPLHATNHFQLWRTFSLTQSLHLL